jgi:hypothetical protein
MYSIKTVEVFLSREEHDRLMQVELRQNPHRFTVRQVSTLPSASAIIITSIKT